MKIAFTICSNNYLSQAKTLLDSIQLLASDYVFYIFLVDEYSSQIDYDFFKPANIVLAKDLPVNFNFLKEKYNIIELNTCIKASCFKYVFEHNSDAVHAHYFDPDIEIFNSLNYLDENFNKYDFLITPHISKILPWGSKEPNENLFLNHGLYNLGYIGLKANSAKVNEMLNWWENRTLNYGFYRLERGLFVDQLWINYVPIYYPEGTKILFHFGCNMGPWNLHERKLKYVNNEYIVNEDYPLVFFHFSSYKYSKPNVISNNYRYDFETNPELISIYNSYNEKIQKNKIVVLSKVSCAYFNNKPSINFLKRIVQYMEVALFKLKYYLNPM